MWLADIKIAVASLRAAKLRTVLTVLGIVIGISAVTTVVALGEGARQTINDQILQFDGRVATVRPGKLTKNTAGEVTNYDLLANFNASTLSEQDIGIVGATDGVESVAPIMGLRGALAGPQRSVDDAQIIATNDDMPDVLGQRLKVGEFVSNAIDRDTVVLGSGLATELLGSDQTIGQTVSVRGQDYTLIGVLEQNNTPLAVNGVYNVDQSAFLTLDAGKALNQGIAQVQAINFRLEDSADPATVTQRVSERLRSAHNADDTAVIGASEALRITEQLFARFTGYIAAVAAISLLVGGVGVMNIMLVAVTERTREIGIRKAVGASNGQILRQFLIEAIIMSLGGGIAGLVLAYLITLIIGFQFSLDAIITWPIALQALAVSLVVGVIFGIFPALRAAGRDPIVALRQLQ